MRVPRPVGGQYFGLYILGKKVGYQYLNLAYVPGSTDKLKFEDTMVMRANVGERTVQRTSSETRIYESRPGGRLLSFVIEHRGDGGDQLLLGTATSTGITVLRRRPGLPDETFNLRPVRETVEDADPVRMALLHQKDVKGVILDAVHLQQYEVHTVLLPPVETMVGGVEVKIQRVSTGFRSGVPMEVSVGPDGAVTEMKMGSQMHVKAEPEAVAKQLDVVEIIGLTRVVLPREPPVSARRVPGKMTLVVKNLPERFWRVSERQKFKRLDADLVEVTITAAPPKLDRRRRRPLADPAGGENLRSTLEVESGRKEVVQLAEKILRDEEDAYASVEKITRWVSQRMEGSQGTSADRTLDVLRQMKGDNTEFALLALSLMRAAGIPAKYVEGLAYQKGSDDVPVLVWYRWVAAYVGEWVYVDPTRGQTVVDATHFSVGEIYSSFADLIGALEVVEVR